MARDPFKGKGDTFLAEEVAELRAKEREFRKEHILRLREDAHAGIDVSIAAAREHFQHKAQALRLSWGGGDPMPPERMADLAAIWAVTQPEFIADLHATINGPAAIGVGDFSELTREQYQKERERLLREIAARDIELERRGAERRKSEADGELAAVEEKVAAVHGARS